MTVNLSIKKFFFDKPAVKKLLDDKTRSALSRVGAFVRQRARSLLRRRKRPSAPGTPPSVHSKDNFATLKNILFAYQPTQQSVVIGPVALNMQDFHDSTLQTGSVPQLHEFGGVRSVTEVKNRDGTYFRPSRKRLAKMQHRTKRVIQARYPKRPFMATALALELPKIPSQFGSEVRAA